MKDNKKETIKNSLESFWRDKKNGDVLYIGDDKVRFMLGEVGTNTIICFYEMYLHLEYKGIL